MAEFGFHPQWIHLANLVQEIIFVAFHLGNNSNNIEFFSTTLLIHDCQILWDSC